MPDLFLEQRKEGYLRVAKNGILVDRRDPALFAEALNRLVDDVDARKTMGKEARRFAGAKFSRERLLTDMEELYLGLAGWRAGTPA